MLEDTRHTVVAHALVEEWRQNERAGAFVPGGVTRQCNRILGRTASRSDDNLLRADARAHQFFQRPHALPDRERRGLAGRAEQNDSVAALRKKPFCMRDEAFEVDGKIGAKRRRDRRNIARKRSVPHRIMCPAESVPRGARRAACWRGAR